MAIADKINQIRKAVYGSQVREAIAGGIEECYTDVQNGVTATNAAKNQMTAQVADAISGINTALAPVSGKIADLDNAISSAQSSVSQMQTDITAAITQANTATQRANTAADNIAVATPSEVADYLDIEIIENEVNENA